MAFVLNACSLSDLVSKAELPSNPNSPNVIKTPAGAMDAYRGVLVSFAKAIGGGRDATSSPDGAYIYETGLLTDELRAGNLTPIFPTEPDGLVDARKIGTGSGPYSVLHEIRGRAQEARGALRTYAPNAPIAYIGHLFALEGFADLFLAEAFCSGVPLGKLIFGGDVEITRGFSTEEIYAQATALFDSATKYATDSAEVLNLAKLGRARILLGLGEYGAAADAVAGVPNNFQYITTYAPTRGKAIIGDSWGYMADRDGLNGLPFASSGDPRVHIPALMDISAPLIVASGLEARLIEAEADIHAQNSRWLVTLNALRTNGTFTTASNPEEPGKIDTTWNAGIGGIHGLRPLEDPGTDTARITLLFTERAYWLYFTGHRQGDLRRLIRVYGRETESVYPTGGWGSQRLSPYGTDIVFPPPQQELDHNPLYRGCIHYGA